MIWKRFLSNQFGNVIVVFYLPLFIPANQIQDPFFRMTDLKLITQYHDWTYISSSSCSFSLVRIYEWNKNAYMHEQTTKEFGVRIVDNVAVHMG